ncbi:hypothetical protein FACS1894116_07900 [Betaproteobacteria bacterium]|nr:hypothetical protein FACS1894116_07900 [Betaproteobacteria bacterium]GHU30188.1 hypothetical protein FACS189497_09560 [Betaproteobacteria bacterium]
MNLKPVGAVLLLLLAIFFLFRLGRVLANRSFGDSFAHWMATLASLFFGWLAIADNNPVGFLGFIPICTYVFLKVVDGLRWEASIKKRAQAGALSAGASFAVYTITHSVFGFGVTEASIGAVVAAGFLGLAGYTA